MRRVIILTQYYPPETGAPQNRLHSLARYLRLKGCDVLVVCAMPNYPKNRVFSAYRGRFRVDEDIDGVPVTRTWIYVSSSRGVVARLLNYFSFAVTSFIRLLTVRRADYIICESPPLFLGITAVLFSKMKRTRLVFNVSDLWPESAEKLNIVSNRLLLRMSYALEAWIYRNSILISGQTRGIVKSIETRFPGKDVVWVPNGVDFDFVEGHHPKADWRGQLGLSIQDFMILYAGVLGHAQGLQVVLHAANLIKGENIHFVIVGDGPEKHALEALKDELGLTNVHFLPNVEKRFIPGLIETSNAYVVPLKNLDLFKGAIPSKLFEPLSLGKPILLGVDGEARQLFIDEARAGLFFEPEDADALAQKAKLLANDRSLVATCGKLGREYVQSNFDRRKIFEEFLTKLKKLTT